MENINPLPASPANVPPSGPLSGKLTIVELFVINAPKLFESPSDVDKWCIIKDNQGGNSGNFPGGNKPAKVDSGIFADSLVLWLGGFSPAKINSGYTLRLDAVTVDEAATSELLEGNLFNAYGSVILAPTRQEIPEEREEKYSLYFWLTNPDGASKQIVIDPILKSNTKTLYHLILNSLNEFKVDGLEGIKKFKEGLLELLK